MSLLLYWISVMVMIEVVSYVFRMSPIMGMILLIGGLYFMGKRRRVIYTNRNTQNNYNSYQNNNEYANYSQYDGDHNYSDAFTNNTYANSKDVFEAEYTEHDVH